MIPLVEASVASECRAHFTRLRVASVGKVQKRTILAFAGVGRCALWISRQVDLPEAVVKAVLKGASK
ncbi:hypothetical protein [Rhodoblastus sp.]|uniref:hypothetical protein n=1 Tax=Rhodoblastus sp. TaxID=1962975 RepID=UPI003F9EB475